MEIWFTARGTFGPDSEAWAKYSEWSGLSGLAEVVSLDTGLNDRLIDIDFDNLPAADWNQLVIDGSFFTDCYMTREFVLARVDSVSIFNFLAVLKEPGDDFLKLGPDGFEFVGFELLDKDYNNSALTNCGGFAETFSASDLNEYGLISGLHEARDIRERLGRNNPVEFHADCFLFAVWRHESIGRFSNESQ